MTAAASSPVIILTKPKPRDSSAESQHRCFRQGKGGHTGVRVHHDFSLVDLAVLAKEVLEESDVDAPGETADVQVVALVADFASPDAKAQPSWSTQSYKPNSPSSVAVATTGRRRTAVTGGRAASVSAGRSAAVVPSGRHLLVAVMAVVLPDCTSGSVDMLARMLVK